MMEVYQSDGSRELKCDNCGLVDLLRDRIVVQAYDRGGTRRVQIVLCEECAAELRDSIDQELEAVR